MARFKKIRWINFLSTGSGGNEIRLDSTRTTLITGKNGSGKSTGVTDALCFALFNKPFRKNITRSQLINSINKKNCLVSVEFDNDGKQYIINRGIKPAIFEIYENGVLLNKESSTRDYQKILEEQILRYNFKTFTQVVLLGSASFIPFMELPKASRREVIEDVLDIGVFSSMNEILKKEFILTKESLADTDNKISLLTEKINSQERIISLIIESNDSIIKEIHDKISEFQERNKILNESISSKKEEIVILLKKQEPYNELIADKEKALRLLNKAENIISQIDSEIAFFETNESCPTCSQYIEEDHKKKIAYDLFVKREKQLERRLILDKAIIKLQENIDKLNNIIKESDLLDNDIRKIEYEVTYNNNEIYKLEKSIEEKKQKTNIGEEKKKLKQLGLEGVSLTESRNELLNRKQLQEQALLLLKDNGIKTSIIREYLPIINRQINKYLDSMEFFCNFEIDEEFNEIIKSRYRDEFSYSSFSQGQKQRIDIAIMFTFRDIAKMKNSLNCDVLVLDEIFSSSLDKVAVSFLVDLLNSLENTHTFVITHHPDEFQESFDRHLQFREVNNFSIMKDLTNG